MSEDLRFLGDHSLVQLRDLLGLLRAGHSLVFNVHTLQQLFGGTEGVVVAESLRRLGAQGWTSRQLAASVDAVITNRELQIRLSYDLVLSGPEVPGIPTRSTHAVLHALIAEAEFEVLLVGYVIHNATSLLLPLASKMQSDPSFNVWCCLDIKRGINDTSEVHSLVLRFKKQFENELWPWNPKPRVYYDPRSLADWGTNRSSLHAKCVVIDRKVAFVTSANFTDAAQHRNIEAGVLSRDPKFALKLHSYFDGLRNEGALHLLPS
jgi:phosphatidylserine/phosphatidylglycerophosphate/cardiolipin synthase-like enzyme